MNLVQARYELALKRMIAVLDAEQQMLAFTRLMMPVPNHADDPDYSRYTDQRFHQVICAALEELEAGRITRLIISLPPRHGKTELASKKFPGWFMGRNPHLSLIFGTYNDKFSQDIGRAVRDMMNSPAYAQVFPNTVLKDDSQAADRLETTAGGVMAFVGRGGTTTGRGGDVLIIDDPLKDRMEADSPTIRDSLWSWFTQVIGTRLMDQTGRIMLIQTRWHQDDLIGRLTDPLNSYYDPQEAKQWKIIDLPALAIDSKKDPLGRKQGEALWPDRFGKDFLHGLLRRDARGFSALYQGQPSPAGGTFFSVKWLKEYRPQELPRDLRYYAASDHAVSLKQAADKTCLMVVGVDHNDHIWILPDLVWRHLTAEQATEAMLRMMRAYKPLFWWAERSHISKSIGPFLRKRMLETSTFCTLIEMQPIADKQTRAQSIQGRMSMDKVHFPQRAPWWPAARDQLLKFPFDQHDDFVDTLAYIGLGLTLQIGASVVRREEQAPEGTFGFLKMQRDMAERSVRQGFGTGGW